VLGIEDMNRASCVGHIEAALKALPGVAVVLVNLATERARVRFSRGSTTLGDLEAVVRNAGYEPLPVEVGPANEYREHEVRERELKALRRPRPATGLSLGAGVVASIGDPRVLTVPPVLC
jgi:Cu+-exporting ATPase